MRVGWKGNIFCLFSKYWFIYKAKRKLDKYDEWNISLQV